MNQHTNKPTRTRRWPSGWKASAVMRLRASWPQQAMDWPRSAPDASDRSLRPDITVRARRRVDEQREERGTQYPKSFLDRPLQAVLPTPVHRQKDSTAGAEIHTHTNTQTHTPPWCAPDGTVRAICGGQVLARWVPLQHLHLRMQGPGLLGSSRQPRAVSAVHHTASRLTPAAGINRTLQHACAHARLANNTAEQLQPTCNRALRARGDKTAPPQGTPALTGASNSSRRSGSPGSSPSNSSD